MKLVDGSVVQVTDINSTNVYVTKYTLDGECIDIDIHPKKNEIEVDCWENVLIKCKYLHQLKNMYYAITGKELEVKL